MSSTELNTKYNQILKAITNDKIALAMSYLKNIIFSDNDWEAQNRVEETEMLYKQMLTYDIKGVDDPNKAKTVHFLRSNLIKIAEDSIERINMRNSNTYIYQQKRLVKSESVLNAREKEIFINSDISKTFTLEFQYELDAFFKRIAFSSSLSKENIHKIQHILQDDNIDNIIKVITISALMHCVLTQYNEDILTLLLESTQSENIHIKIRSELAIVFVLCEYGDRVKIDEHNYLTLLSLLDDKNIVDDLEYIYTQLVRTYENKVLTQKITNEILPEMMKMKSDDIFKIGMDDDEEDAFNPNWQEAIENSSLGEKLREFGELQLSGADVYAGTFVQMKTHSFFNSVSNWFLPFDQRNTAINQLFVQNAELLNVLARSSQLCNSDKYSFFLTMTAFPSSQIDMLVGSMTEQMEQMKEEFSSDRWKQGSDENKQQIVRQYVQDLYRFYNYFPYRNDYNSPLKSTLRFYKQDVFKELFKTPKARLRIAEYYFEKDCYEQALDLYEELENLIDTNVSFYQKMAYANLKCGRNKAAIKAFDTALQFEPNDLWTLKSLLKAYRNDGDLMSQCAVLENLCELQPNSLSIIKKLTNIYIETLKYADAEKLLYKLHYFEPSELATIRLLIHTLIQQKNFEKALTYIVMIDDYDKLSETDYLNLIYLDFINGNVKTMLQVMKLLYVYLDRDSEKYIETIYNRELMQIFNITPQSISSWVESVLVFDNPETII